MLIQIFDEVAREDVEVGMAFDLEDEIHDFWTVTEVNENGLRLEADGAKVFFSWEEMGL